MVAMCCPQESTPGGRYQRQETVELWHLLYSVESYSLLDSGFDGLDYLQTAGNTERAIRSGGGGAGGGSRPYPEAADGIRFLALFEAFPDQIRPLVLVIRLFQSRPSHVHVFDASAINSLHKL